MTQIFDPAFVGSHDFYHARYGLGAVVVAIPKGPDLKTTKERRSRGLHAARLFAERNGRAPDFEPILAIEEQSGGVRMKLEFERRSPRDHKYILASAVIERIVPVERVTLEIIHTNKR